MDLMFPCAPAVEDLRWGAEVSTKLLNQFLENLISYVEAPESVKKSLDYHF